MKQAKPTTEDFDELEYGIQQILVAAGSNNSDALVRSTIKAHRSRIELSLGRVINAGRLLVQNVCDKKLDYIEYKPELKSAIALAEAVKGVLQ